MTRDHERLRDILEFGERIRRHTGPGRAVLDDEVVAAAVTRWMEVIGEAAGAVSAELRADYPEVAWRDLVGMRNILAHAYRRVNLDLVWRAVERLPEIERQVADILASRGGPCPRSRPSAPAMAAPSICGVRQRATCSGLTANPAWRASASTSRKEKSCQ